MIINKLIPIFSLIVAMAISTSWMASAQEISSFGKVGPHHQIFILEKTQNPQNIMVIYTQVDSNCHFLQRAKKPVFNFYWKMDHKTYKPVHPMIQHEVEERLTVLPAKDSDRFSVKINDLSEVKNDIPDPHLEINATKEEDGDCEVEGLMTLGPSDQNATLRLESIFTESKKTIVPPFHKLVAVTLRGTDSKTGKEISHRYEAR